MKSTFLHRGFPSVSRSASSLSRFPTGLQQSSGAKQLQWGLMVYTEGTDNSGRKESAVKAAALSSTQDAETVIEAMEIS